ncbi:MAG: methyltransferase domain-containing protein [bacterium]|nr:methyltransferase domain-containing protein [bacterium]
MSKEQQSEHLFLDPEKILHDNGVVPGMKIADFGCGSGYFVLPAARIVGDQGIVFGVDVLKNALSSLASKSKLFNLSNIVPVWANVEIYGASRGIHDHKLDMVLLIQLLSQTHKMDEVFKEVDRTLSHDGGKILVVDWKTNKFVLGPDKELLNKQDIINAAQKYRIILDHEFNPGSYHFGLVFRRA